MRRERAKQTLKLRLLAFVLALALVWYSLNPAPKPITLNKREDELPDEKKRNVESQSMPATLSVAFRQLGERAESFPAPGEGEDDFEWPEFIDD
jgi:hypothetical protein